MRQSLRRLYFKAINNSRLRNRISIITKENAQNQPKPLLTKPIPTFIIDAINEASPRFIVGKNAAYTDFPTGQWSVGNICLYPLDETKGGLLRLRGWKGGNEGKN